MDSKINLSERFSPFKNSLVISLSYNNRYERGLSDKEAYNYNDITSKYDIVDSAATGNIRNTFIEHNAGLSLSYRSKTKWNARLGFNYLSSVLKNDDTFNRYKIKSQRENNYTPRLNITKMYGPSNYLSFDFSERSKQPTIEQLQPVIDHSQPLFIKTGNINLKSEFINTLSIKYNTMRSTMEVSSNVVKNKIIDQSTVDSLGVRRTSPINENGIWNIKGSYDIYNYLSTKKITFTNSLMASYNRNIGYMNAVKYSSDIISASERVKVRYNGKYLQSELSLSAMYSTSNYSLHDMNDKSTWTNSVNATINWSLPFKMNLLADYTYSFFFGFQYDNKPASVLNVELSKQLFNNRCVLSIKGFDILNQTKNIKVAYGDDYTQETSSNVVKRYFLVNMSYRFGKFGN